MRRPAHNLPATDRPPDLVTLIERLDDRLSRLEQRDRCGFLADFSADAARGRAATAPLRSSSSPRTPRWSSTGASSPTGTRARRWSPSATGSGAGPTSATASPRSTSSSSLRVPDLLMSIDGNTRLSARRRSSSISELPVPLNSSKITSSMREPVSISAVAMIVRLPPVLDVAGGAEEPLRALQGVGIDAAGRAPCRRTARPCCRRAPGG